MHKLFLTIAACFLALCASVTGAQTSVDILDGPKEQQVVFGARNVSHGSIRITTAAEKFWVPPLTFKVRACSTWLTGGVPLETFTLSKGSTVYPGTASWIDGERVVTFPTESIQGPYTTSTYALHSDVVSFASGSSSDKQCYRIVLERSGIPSKEQLDGSFPIELRANTIVRSKPTVTITAIGAIKNRVRIVSDDVFVLSISADGDHKILIKELSLRFSGATLPAGGSDIYQIIDDGSNTVLGFGYLPGGNIMLTTTDELYVDAGSSRSLRVRVNSTEFQDTPNSSDSLSVQITNRCDFQWDTSSGNTGGPGQCLEQQVVPITATVSYE